MSAPTPRTDSVYLEHRHWANEDEATEAIEDLRDLARELEQELAADRARLDWLMAGGVCMVQHSGGFYVSRLHAQVSRAVIDSAMKEETK